jgi:Transcription factor WhiB
VNNPNPKTDPDCPAPGAFHGTYKAVKRRKCTCDGSGHQALTDERERERLRKAAIRADPDRKRAPVSRLPGTDPTIGDLELALLLRDDLPCRETDPELFYVEGFGAAAEAQVRVAKSICRGCAWVEECREVAITNGDAWAVQGMTTPAERRALRRQKAGAAA